MRRARSARASISDARERIKDAYREAPGHHGDDCLEAWRAAGVLLERMHSIVRRMENEAGVEVPQ